MQQTEVLYTCNVTVNPEKYDIQIQKIPSVLEILENILEEVKIKGVFFIDTSLFLKIQETNHELYIKIRDILRDIDNSDHDLQLFINPIWETTKELHELDQEQLLDLFAQGKYILQDLYSLRNKERLMAVRVYSGRIQPFQYLKEVYQILGAKIDMSILPRMRGQHYFDFSSVRFGEAIRFSDDPNVSDRFGKYLGISRGIFKNTVGLKMSVNRKINALFAQDENNTKTFLDENREKPNLISIPISNQKKYSLLSPDVVPLSIFQKIIDKQKNIIKHICVLESSLENITPFTQDNLEYITSSNVYHTLSLNEVADKYSTTYKIKI